MSLSTSKTPRAKLRIVGRTRLVERAVERLTRRRRANDMRGYDDHKVGLPFQETRRAEQGSDHRQLPQARQLLDIFRVDRLQQARQCETLTIT